MGVKFWIALTLVIVSGPAWSATIDAQAINEAQWSEKKPAPGGLNPLIVKLQVLLDRARFSPGEIDGKSGENVDKAAAAYAAAQNSSSGLSADVWQKLTETFKGPIIVEHKISEADVKGPFAEKRPAHPFPLDGEAFARPSVGCPGFPSKYRHRQAIFRQGLRAAREGSAAPRRAKPR